MTQDEHLTKAIRMYRNGLAWSGRASVKAIHDEHGDARIYDGATAGRTLTRDMRKHLRHDTVPDDARIAVLESNDETVILVIRKRTENEIMYSYGAVAAINEESLMLGWTKAAHNLTIDDLRWIVDTLERETSSTELTARPN